VHDTAAPAAGLAVFAVFCGDLSAINISFSAEILGCRGFGDLRKQPDHLGDAAVLRCLWHKCNNRKLSISNEFLLAILEDPACP
jgi:hypothetical protein